MGKREHRDPVKQRAGRAGARARWRNDLQWHRRLEKLRGGFSGSWRVILWHTVFRFVFLYRAHGRKLSEEDETELLSLIRPPLRLPLVIAVARCPQGEWERGSILNTRWTRRTICRWLNVTEEEARQLNPPAPPQPSRRERRLAAMILLRDRLLAKERRFPTVRWMQQALAEHGIPASFETVRQDLQKLPLSGGD